MIPLTNLKDLIAYSEEIKAQKEALQNSTVFNPIEKIEVSKIYKQLEQITIKRINHLQDLNDATNA